MFPKQWKHNLILWMKIYFKNCLNNIETFCEAGFIFYNSADL